MTRAIILFIIILIVYYFYYYLLLSYLLSSYYLEHVVLVFMVVGSWWKHPDVHLNLQRSSTGCAKAVTSSATWRRSSSRRSGRCTGSSMTTRTGMWTCPNRRTYVNSSWYVSFLLFFLSLLSSRFTTVCLHHHAKRKSLKSLSHLWPHHRPLTTDVKMVVFRCLQAAWQFQTPIRFPAVILGLMKPLTKWRHRYRFCECGSAI